MPKNKVKVVQRYQIADYLNINQADDEAENYVLMGTGFTTLDEEPGAQSESTKYINEKSASSDIVSYETKFPFEADQVEDQEAIEALYKVGRNHLTGSDAQFEYVRVELNRKAGTGSTSFEARKFLVSAEISSFEGENKMKMSGNLNAVGDPVLGTFDVSTKKFTPAGTTVQNQ